MAISLLTCGVVATAGITATSHGSAAATAMDLTSDVILIFIGASTNHESTRMNTNFLNADASDFSATRAIRDPAQRTLGSTGCQPVVFGSLPKSGKNQRTNHSPLLTSWLWTGSWRWRGAWPRSRRTSPRAWGRRRSRCRRRASLRTVSAAAIPSIGIPNASAPNDHFITGPHCRVTSSSGRCVNQASSNPAVCARRVSPTRVEKCVPTRNSAPDDHFIARPDCGVRRSATRCIHDRCRSPTVRDWIVSSPSIRVAWSEAAPDDHLISRPNCRM